MYRDDPLDDEADLRAVVGDDRVDLLLAAGGAEAVAAAVDLLRLAQGWVDDDEAAAWLTGPRGRLDGLTPLEVLATGGADLVADALRAWLTARG
ncbi:MAG: antitoxin Xre/MbcA/ParS toxin-binding domain-containing protein [Nitriliruptoraceae bacterium]